MQPPSKHPSLLCIFLRKPTSPKLTHVARGLSLPVLTPYLFPKALVPGCTGQASAGCPAHSWGPVQLEQRPGPQCLGQGLELAQPLPLQFPDRLALPRTLQLLDECYWKREVGAGSLRLRSGLLATARSQGEANPRASQCDHQGSVWIASKGASWTP